MTTAKPFPPDHIIVQCAIYHFPKLPEAWRLLEAGRKKIPALFVRDQAAVDSCAALKRSILNHPPQVTP